ncbi:MAG: hypothetical protein IKR85_00355 [Clostridia bacterium]|nr:hypothetical protein [Clostridia bacterium]
MKLIRLLCAAFVLVFMCCTCLSEDAGLREGDVILLGVYEQNNDFSDGPEPIEWIVFEIHDDGSALLLSKYCLECMVFSDVYTNISWDKCSLRRWMNGEFYDSAFTEEEKALLLETSLETPANPIWGSRGGAPTVDKVFLPSTEEICDHYGVDYKYYWYWHGDDELRGYPTAYAEARGVYLDETYGTCTWWLRTPGGRADHATVSIANGRLSDYAVRGTHVALRFEIRISIEDM